MKKIISIISIILAFTMLSTINAFALAPWETEQTPIDVIDSGSETNDPTNEQANVPTDEQTNEQTTAEAVSIKKCSVSNIKNKTYTGDSITQNVTVKFNGKTLKNKTDYTVSYKNNINVGTATVVIKGTGSYKDSISKTFKINPKGTSLSKYSLPKAGQIKLYWNRRASQTKGYQIQLATDSAFSKNKQTITVANNKTKSKTVKSLKKKKTYYIRIRTYSKDASGKYYSSWSKTKTVKTK